MPNADTSKLEVVNRMLAISGADAVNSLDTNVSATVALAIRILDEENKNLQVRGWHWNTEPKVTITADATNRFAWQTDWIRVDTEPDKYSDTDIVRRGSYLFNRYPGKNTNVFTRSTMEVIIVRFLDWTTLPEAARQFVKARASRVFAFADLGDEFRSGYSQLDEDKEYQHLVEAENEQADYNFMHSGIAPGGVNRYGGDVFHLPTH